MDLAGAKRKPWSGLGANTAILRTFSVVRDEALEVLFKSNTFSIYLGGDHLSVDFEGGPRQLGYILTPGKAEQIFGLNYRRIARLSIDIRISPTHCGLILTHISDFLKSLSVKVIRYIISYPVKNNKEISPYSSESADIQHLIESRQGDFVLLGGLIVNLFLQIPITIKVFWGPRVTEEDADRLNGVGHVPERVILNILEKYQRLYFQSPHPVAELDSKRRVRYREDL
ncbi:hypothetical protein M501DRAFT_994041 [Patellaria atrata CBS 101060]|uniref:Uncharacterized protein n=1 Tax=Patellaria atrata CBS 101060 TaxID=1346257 RepID=A0A9P4SIL2_9PEZI|nr:hypothetical protein M501DRAFT_994041 [Patellaria atrata CBS 101060]